MRSVSFERWENTLRVVDVGILSGQVSSIPNDAQEEDCEKLLLRPHRSCPAEYVDGLGFLSLSPRRNCRSCGQRPAEPQNIAVRSSPVRGSLK